MTAITATPTVLVVLVAHDGVAWLPRTLDALAAQSYPAIDVVAVDNVSEDGSRELLFDRLGPERVLLADRDIGFGAAVSMALDARAASDAPYVMTLHDDCALHEDAVAELVEAMTDDPRLAVVGPKLRSWESDGVLQSVGWTIDTTGRADSGVDPGELDQGQRDQDRRALYVSTSAMLVRRDVFDEIGRFDRRYHVFRDDLDLCWRIWLTGHDVEVIPSAVGEHVAGATNYLRLGQTRFIGPRYFAERNTLATLLKNYGPARLLLVVPLFFVVGLAKILGFVLTRRFSDAWQTLRAWLWNVVHLRETRRYRRQVQRARSRTDRELSELFGRVGPRVRAYAEAMASWVTGGDVAPAPEPLPVGALSLTPRRATNRIVHGVRRRPVLLAGGLLTLLVLVGTWPLLLPGELRGGELAPWPATAGAFLTDYVAGWHEAGAFGTAEAPSPAQALLGMLQVLFGGSAYLASRAVLLLPLATAWLLALRAAQVFSERRLPRVVAATAYVLSPPALAALAAGRIGALITLAALPGIVAGWTTMARRASPPARAWRAVAGVTLLTAIGGAFEPAVLVAVVVAGALATVIGLVAAADIGWRIALTARAGVAVAGPVVLLLPWSLDVLAADGPLAGTTSALVGGELWRWLLLAPDMAGFPGVLGGVGFLLAGLLGLVLGVRRSPGLAAVLWTAALAGAVSSWWLDRTLSVVWSGLPLLVTAAAFAGLFALAFASGEAQLSQHAFGWRQLAALATAAGVTVSIGVVGAGLVTETWDVYALDDPPLPSFVVAAAQEEGPFRTLVLAADENGSVAWEVVDGEGPSMASYGLEVPAAATVLVDDIVEDVLSEGDPGATDRLGTLGVRYIVVPDGTTNPALDAALATQTGIEPRPVANGRLFAVGGWMPRAVAVSASTADTIDALGAPPPGASVVELEPGGGGTYVGQLPGPSSVLVAEVADDGWRATVGTAEITAADAELVRFDELPEGQVSIAHAGTTGRGLEVTGQVLAVLLAISLALRPPGFARSHAGPEDRQEGSS